MLSKLFLGMSLMGAEWILYILVLVSVISIGTILERYLFYRETQKGIREFRDQIRSLTQKKDWQSALSLSETRLNDKRKRNAPDFESLLTSKLLSHSLHHPQASAAVLSEIGQDAVLQTKIIWENRLALLATIGSNAPFVGLFGTVIGVIQAFHDLSQRSPGGAQTVTAGISDALIATAVGILVAIPAVVAFNLFQRQVKKSLNEAEALKSFLIGNISSGSQT